MNTKKYKVIKIVDPYSILINYGYIEGAKINSKVQIIELGPEIKDPDTNKILGTFDNVKANLLITEVFENFSLCQNIISKRTSVFINPLAELSNVSTEKKALNVSNEEISNLKRPCDNTIRIGDIAKIL